MKTKKIYFLVCLLFASAAYAGGYRVSVQGNKQLAMGHAGVAVISSAESLFFNPAAMSFLDGNLNVSLGVSGVFSNVAFQNADLGISTTTDGSIGTPLYGYGSYKINDWLSVGLAIYTPYGSKVAWPTDWAGSHLVNNIELQSIFIQPTVSIKLSQHLSIGGGPIYAIGSVNFNRNLSRTLANTEGERTNVTIDASGITAWGYNVGLLFRPSTKLNIGLNYRSEILVEADGGEADFENVPSALPGDFSDTTFDATLPLPAELTVGLSYQVTNKVLLAIDFNRAYWNVYEALDVQFNNSAGLSQNPRNYENASTYRFGLQYTANQRFVLRGGFYFDESPIQDGFYAPETPRNDSVGFTGGFTININSRLAVDASFLYLRFAEVDNSYDFFSDGSSFGGTYKSNAFIPGIGLSYKL
ncbi:OmpP1/FadL family transporter [Spongiivirga citrea]|uniref:Transporter n=1 Tax=Spongiivirga citrea TaxID=1481457 RepID=A0A6M0CJL6_9FLAO|nr:outer membrane protein transport protein [Spongiivirga citrea]NER18135.1 transporter [Spongiivirga citrea]